jgi:hypothetical protein
MEAQPVDDLVGRLALGTEGDPDQGPSARSKARRTRRR